MFHLQLKCSKQISCQKDFFPFSLLYSCLSLFVIVIACYFTLTYLTEWRSRNWSWRELNLWPRRWESVMLTTNLLRHLSSRGAVAWCRAKGPRPVGLSSQTTVELQFQYGSAKCPSLLSLVNCGRNVHWQKQFTTTLANVWKVSNDTVHVFRLDIHWRLLIHQSQNDVSTGVATVVRNYLRVYRSAYKTSMESLH